MVRNNFQPCTTPQLEQIVRARLAAAACGLGEEWQKDAVLAPDGLKVAPMKVASVSGRVARVGYLPVRPPLFFSTESI